MKISYVRSMVLIVLAFNAAGCATIVSGTTQKVSVSSQPSGADAKADGNITVKTPALLTLDRKSDHVIEFSKEGYKSMTVYVRKAFNEMATGNILLGGIIGAGVDAASGSGNKLVPERIDVKLEEGSGTSEAALFATQKDQEFYEKSVLKQQIAADQKAAKKEADMASASTTTDLAPAAGNNFGPKGR